MALTSERLFEIVEALATQPRHEAVRTHVCALLTEGLGADLLAVKHETRVVEARGRIDALLGRTILEFKSDYKRERRDAIEELGRYLPERENATGDRFVAIATDGLYWEAFEWRDGAVFSLREYTTDTTHPDALLSWLDGAVATRGEIPPDALNVINELGRESVACQRSESSLRAGWAEVKDHPTASLQRQLWASLLKLVYGKEADDDDLWIQHTYLVIVAKCLAARVIGLEAEDPDSIMTGKAFADARVFGAVESDFFDWILVAPNGRELVQKISRHVSRFKLRDVETDVLKVLYESLIDRAQRHGLGEYYTPDWLAAKVVRHAVDRPLEQRVLDPACGSGAFLFHTIRRFIEEAQDAGMDANRIAISAVDNVAGMDIHPVAVIIARVTVLLALGPAMPDREGDISIPVYLGDALQLSVREFMRKQELTVIVPPMPGQNGVTLSAGSATGGDRNLNGHALLVFPEALCKAPALFDRLIEAMTESSLAGRDALAFQVLGDRLVQQHYRRDATRDETKALEDLSKTYLIFDELRRIGRDTIWGYVARNLSRPLAFSASDGWANVLIGNPPWVAFRHMSEDLQKRFKELAKNDYDINVGGKLATQNDLCALFVAMTTRLYLRAAGKVAVVLPLATMSRGQFAKFRLGRYGRHSVRWEEAWTMDDSVSPLFPVPSCVLFGLRRAVPTTFPTFVRAYSGRLPLRDASEEVADERLTVREGVPAPAEGKTGREQQISPFAKMFRQGATLVPRMTCLVTREQSGRLGSSAANPLVTSRRNNQEKEPWRSLPSLRGNIEAEFLRPVLLGESILPWRVETPFEGVIPVQNGVVLSADVANQRALPGLYKWMKAGEAVWDENGGGKMTLSERFGYHAGLGNQFPIASLRVVFAASGTHPAASLVRTERAVVEHKLYWAVPESEDEAYFITALLNSETTRNRIESLQSRGQFGARDFDKVMFTLPIPRCDVAIALHRNLSQFGREAEACAAATLIPSGTNFQRARKTIRQALAADGISERIDRLVDELLTS